MVFPYTHVDVIRPTPDVRSLTPGQFDFREIGDSIIVINEGLDSGERNWPAPIPMPSHHATRHKMDEPGVWEPSLTENERLVIRIREELRSWNRENGFPDSVAEMLFRLGEIHGLESRTSE
jgi:hypothetical protein